MIISYFRLLTALRLILVSNSFLHLNIKARTCVFIIVDMVREAGMGLLCSQQTAQDLYSPLHIFAFLAYAFAVLSRELLVFSADWSITYKGTKYILEYYLGPDDLRREVFLRSTDWSISHEGEKCILQQQLGPDHLRRLDAAKTFLASSDEVSQEIWSKVRYNAKHTLIKRSKTTNWGHKETKNSHPG